MGRLPVRRAESPAPIGAAQGAPWHARLARLLGALERGLVERSQVLRLTLLAALAGEHTLLIGPPGTAKSALARRIHLAFCDARYFERLLTRFTVPEELFGPLSIRALEEDRYERHTTGFLPDATVAFIDEVFKANSAILNALLTLLNEREFDNGAGRQRCPLVSVVGATNVVPEDEVGEAFLDRFLVRLTVGPVSAEGFHALLAIGTAACNAEAASSPLPAGLALATADRDALVAAAAAVSLPDTVRGQLAALRGWLTTERIQVSDRRWVKIAQLLRMAAATEGRAAVLCWDLAVVPCCIAAAPEVQQAVADWLARRLGVREAIAPPRLTRVVEAFEAQLAAEQAANDLDYDAAGRLRFSTADPLEGRAVELAAEVGDTKGGAAAVRLRYSRQRRYGALHVAARLEQIDDLLRRLGRYEGEVAAQRAELVAWGERSLWVDPSFVARADAALADTAAALSALAGRIRKTRAGFEALPRLPDGPATLPAPIEHDPLAD